MRAKTFITLAAVAVGMILLTGCTGGSNSAQQTPAPPVDLCSIAAPSGPVSEAVLVEGEFGAPAATSFAHPLAITGAERSIVVEGGGPALNSASLVTLATTVFDAATGVRVRTTGYDDAATLPIPAVNVGQLLGCATVGSRVLVAVPETDQDGPTIWVLDVLGAQASKATGKEQKPVEGMPTVELASSGAPTITIPGEEPPTKTTVTLLKKGDGAVVASGDSVMVQYTGVRWSNGEVFDSSWNNGAPTALVTTDLIDGYRQALEGQKVGSQVLVVIPPKSAYGGGEINEDDLTGETLVFVIDILAAVPTV